MTIANHVLDLFMPDGGKGGPSLDSMLEQFDKELENFDTLVQPAPESKPRTPFDSPGLRCLPGGLPIQPIRLCQDQVPVYRQSQRAPIPNSHGID